MSVIPTLESRGQGAQKPKGTLSYTVSSKAAWALWSQNNRTKTKKIKYSYETEVTILQIKMVTLSIS